MKTLTFIILSLLTFISSTVQAELSPLEKLYIEGLNSGEIREIKKVAKIINRSNVTNTDVLDVAAEVLLQTYPSIKTVEIKPLAMIIRTLGNSKNGRYYSVLKEVNDSSSRYKKGTAIRNKNASKSLRKLQKYSSEALNKVSKTQDNQYTRGMISLKDPATIPEEPLNANEQILVSLLKTGNTKTILDTSKYILYSALYKSGIFDAVEEALSKNTLNSREELESASIMVRLLAESYNNKYEDTVLAVSKRTTDAELQVQTTRSLIHLAK